MLCFAIHIEKRNTFHFAIQCDSSSGRAFASHVVGQDRCRIDTWPRHTKEVIKMVPLATLFGIQQYTASTGFSSLAKHSLLTLHMELMKKSLIMINVWSNASNRCSGITSNEDPDQIGLLGSV